MPITLNLQSEWRGTKQVVRLDKPNVERLKEFLKAILMGNQTKIISWRQEVQDYFLTKSQEVKKDKNKGEKMKWCLPVGEGEPVYKDNKELVLQKAQELARSLRDREVANKFKRLVARVSVCQDKNDFLVAVARYFPNLKSDTQKAINAFEEQWQAWDLRSLQQLFLLAKIFLEANK